MKKLHDCNKITYVCKVDAVASSRSHCLRQLSELMSIKQSISVFVIQSKRYRECDTTCHKLRRTYDAVHHWVERRPCESGTHLNALGMSGEASTTPLIPTLYCSYYYNDINEDARREGAGRSATRAAVARFSALFIYNMQQNNHK